jgi:hypothetical protein
MPNHEPDLERGRPPGGGKDPTVPEDPGLPPADPRWRPSDLLRSLQARFGGQLRERQRSQLWFPHLLIRGAPGDRGQRPLWEPTPCWASPDIHLLPQGAPVDLSQTILSPRVGEQYTVAVHIWNLGRFPAFGVTVRAWWVEPGFFAGTTDPRYQPRYIGGTFTELGDRDSGSAHRIVTIPQPWLVEDQAEGHECLFAVVDAFADPWPGALASNSDRHVAQRNLTLIRGSQSTAPILELLGAKVDTKERLTLHLGTFRPASLKGAAARGTARSSDTQVGFGPATLGEPRRIATLARGDGTWLTDRLRRRDRPGVIERDRPPQAAPSSLTPAGSDRLSEVVALLLGARGTTAADLLASPHLGGARSAALHLSTAATGYTVLLQD